ncbi:MAG: type II toxin-antitoxin system RelE/ParE family toxin [Bryobacterales bacterium]|nr:type II toxin-antitoxin system RelE/ParE family toxin [Bryobacterales bacterium]
MKRFVLTPDAAQDLDDIWEYIAADSPEAADRLIGEIYDQLLALASTPGMGHRREDLAEDRPLLFWPVGNYLVLYRTIKGLVEVVAVAHGKRDIPSFIGRRGI